MNEIFKNELITLLGDAGLMERIYMHVSCGGSLIGFCKLQDVAYTHVRRWLRNDKDREKQYAQALTEREEWTKERVLDELKLIGYLDPTEVYGPNGELTDPSTWPEHIKRNISAIEVKEEFDTVDGTRVFSGYTKRVKFHDKLKAIDMIGKNITMWAGDRDKDDSTVKLEDLLALAIKMEKANNS